MDLREYEQKKFAIAEILRAASRVIPDDRTEWRQRLQDLFTRLAEDRFNLVVVGRFSRGKTSLMNAILGSDRLPTGIAPLTSVITTVTYGSKEQVVLKYDNRLLDSEIPISALPQHITQQGNPGNVRRIRTAEVQLPTEILRRGFYFVDTPGLGSVIVENTLTTESFLPEADAFILVTSYESPLSEEEMNFFRAGSSSGTRIFVVLNKHDTVSLDDRNAVLAFVREQLRRIFGRSTPQIFSVSSIDGLEARRSRDPLRLARSGIPELEKQLVRFLLTEKSTEFLVRMCNRIQEFLRELPRSNEIANLNLQLGALAKQFVAQDEPGPTEEPLEGSTVAFPNMHRLRSCEICASIAEKLWDFLCQYQYEIIVNHDEQERFAKRGGFCPFHTWEYESAASPYGTCNGYPTLLDRLVMELRNPALMTIPRDILITRIQNLLPTQDDCTLCRVRDEAEQQAIAAAARRLDENKTNVPGSLSITCLPHFTMLVAAVRDDDVVRDLIGRQAAVLQRVSEDMRRYALKHDALRRYLASKEETSVAERGLLSVAGLRQVNFAPRRTGAPRSDRVPVGHGPAINRAMDPKGSEHVGEPGAGDRVGDQQAKIDP
jgi:small GTP-binding protein